MAIRAQHRQPARAPSAQAPAPSRWTPPRPKRIPDWWPWSFLPLGLVYVVIAWSHFNHMLVNTFGSSDASSAPVLGELDPSRVVGHVVLAILPFFSTLIFEDATRWLPLHREVWAIGPYLLGVVSIALMSWASWRIAGRWAAALTAVILLCAGPAVLEYMLWLNDHSTSWYSLALLAAFLVLVAERGSSLGWLPLAGLTLGVGALVGINLASDKLLLVAGLLPLLLAGVGTWVLSRTAKAVRLLSCTLAASGVIVVSAVATTSIMHSEGIFAGSEPLSFANNEALSNNVRFWWESIAVLGNGSFFGETVDFKSVMALICAAMSVGVILLIPRYTWRYIRDRRSREEPVDERRTAYMIFWSAGIVCLSIGFVLNSTTFGLGTTRYLVGLVYAVAAILPLVARSSVAARAIVVGSVLVYLLNSVIALADSNLIKAPSTQGPSPQVAADVAKVAQRMDATHGFALYWDASSITWRSNFKVVVAPIVGCENPKYPGSLCPGPYNYLEEWYYDRPDRTFVLTDSFGPDDVWKVPKTLGPTIGTYHFGTVTMYVYDHNVVSTLLAP